MPYHKTMSNKNKFILFIFSVQALLIVVVISFYAGFARLLKSNLFASVHPKACAHSCSTTPSNNTINSTLPNRTTLLQQASIPPITQITALTSKCSFLGTKTAQNRRFWAVPTPNFGIDPFCRDLIFAQNCIKNPDENSAIFETTNTWASTQSDTSSNNQAESFYAKARQNCVLFLSTNVSDTSPSNVLFVVPVGYFVKVVAQPSSSVYQVTYDSYLGYIAAKDAKRVSFVPNECTPPTQTLITKSDGGTQLRALASTQSDTVALVPAGSSVEYIATATGTKPEGGLSQNWHYVRYFPASQPTIYHEGYIYSERTTTQPSVPTNTEDDKPQQLPQNQTPTSTKAKNSSFPLWLKGIIISLLCLPLLLFLLYLIRRHFSCGHSNPVAARTDD